MKRILTLSVLFLLLLSILALSSCNVAKTVVDSIDGLTPKEAYDLAIEAIESADKYETRLNMRTEVKVLGITVYALDIEDFYYYIYEGENQHCGITDSAKEKLEDEDVADVLDGYEDELWYVDGICYLREGNSKTCFASSYSPILKSEYEEAVEEILDGGIGEYTCYKDGDRYYFTIEVSGEDAMLDSEAESEIYTVYFTEDGYLDEIFVDVKYAALVSYKVGARYLYGDAVKSITPPEDADSYVRTN